MGTLLNYCPMKTKNEVANYLENVALLLFGILLFAFPLVFTTLTTDLFLLPKQILLGVTALIGLLLFGAHMIAEGKARIRRTPFDVPVFLFGIVAVLSAVFAINQTDALIAVSPLMLSLIAGFLMYNFVRNRNSLSFLTGALVLGAAVTAVFALLQTAKIYILPFDFAKAQTFTPFGSLLDQAIYLAALFPLALAAFLLVTRQKGAVKVTPGLLFSALSTLVIAGGLIASVYQLIAIQQPIILPFETGFQTAFAAISQDAGRVAQGFFFGSGYGTYLTDFTRFKHATFNLNPDLWGLTFLRSSSFVLELLATTGVLGLAAFLFLAIRFVQMALKDISMRQNIVFFSLFTLFLLSFLLPFSFVLQALLFLLFGLFTAGQALTNHKSFFDIELDFVALKKGAATINPFYSGPVTNERSFTRIMPVVFFLVFLAFIVFFGWFAVRYVAADVIFQKSLVAAAENNGLQTYNDQTNAIATFNRRDAFYRVYSQTNLALANSLLENQPANSSPSAEVQETIYRLIQQSIESARSATAVSPLNTVNWQNLASIYRALIGFGQNADAFTIASLQQAIALDPNNPQLYVQLGGVYYQLQQWENAQRQFQIAVQLKPDYANAYYNLGHALEEQGNFEAALTQYEAVRTLTANEPQSKEQITKEIDAIKKKIAERGQQPEAQQAGNQVAPATGDQEPLGVNTPDAQLPQQRNPVEIPAPTISPLPSPTQGATSPTPAQ